MPSMATLYLAEDKGSHYSHGIFEATLGNDRRSVPKMDITKTRGDIPSGH